MAAAIFSLKAANWAAVMPYEAAVAGRASRLAGRTTLGASVAAVAGRAKAPVSQARRAVKVLAWLQRLWSVMWVVVLSRCVPIITDRAAQHKYLRRRRVT